ncbi:hypothetical protein N7448_006243 [Penicillium atrosanguineum]|uniref:Uncharacterized protein n=1 Tax=Penicillium atrosanguineum TaxID=1132637 RepID=A0A9W9GXX5_9EURO|nr:uncharacterized protein N7443_010005 [Penicillium atrosanguineum]KAJ5132085.1 hypothetical protein N7448_006243 [Penicillium atrosanguineum]KAJ5137705.1 hypothetical protein N7526_003938 [Penicillium atrosanguineum]KAJ5289752.1 hypothetical protein N7443_010005 [Penicillium atrosanguineum]KAJ5307573.1 hypothetical protein N7476_008229 [Penicillium atrosanguineum]
MADTRAPDPRFRKQPNRQSRSCKVCRLRKVKCDRVKPCHACCAHGYPSKCVYENVPDEDAQPISQAEEIRNLRDEIRDLRARIDVRQDGSRAQDLQRLDQLESLFESIRSAPPRVVESLVKDIRTAHGGLKDELVPVGPWEGHDAYKNYGRQSRGSSVSTLVVRNRGSDVEEINFNDSVEYDEDDYEDEISVRSGSDSSSSGATSIMNMQRPVVDVFVERFVDAFAPEVDLKSGRAGALRAAAGIRMFSPLISDAYEAVSVAFFGRSVQNKQIEASGFRLYPRVLRGLQDALNDPERCKAESTLVTVILLLAFESVERTTQSGVSAHVRGAVRLIEHRGPENHMYGVEHLMFTELRPYWITLMIQIGGALAARKPSFLAEEEWKTIPWSAGTTTKDILHHLLDLAADIPGLLAQSDAFQEKQLESVMSTHEIAVKQSTLWNGITELTAKLRQWVIDWVECYPDGAPREVEQTEDQDFPIFQRRDLRTGAIFTPTKISYPNLLLAQTMCLYYSFRLILSSVDKRPVDRVTPMEQYDLGCGICRTLEWYILTAPGNMINRLAFPTRVAWEAFPDGGPERQFLVEVLQLVEKRHALGLWGSAMPELSVRENSPLNSDSP